MSRQHQSATIQETQTPLVQGLSGGVGMTCLVSGGPCSRGGQRLGLQLHLGARWLGCMVYRLFLILVFHWIKALSVSSFVAWQTRDFLYYVAFSALLCSALRVSD